MTEQASDSWRRTVRRRLFVAGAVLVQIHHRLLHHVLGGGAVAQDRPRDRQQTTGMLPHCPLEQIFRRVRHRAVTRFLS